MRLATLAADPGQRREIGDRAVDARLDFERDRHRAGQVLRERRAMHADQLGEVGFLEPAFSQEGLDVHGVSIAPARRRSTFFPPERKIFVDRLARRCIVVRAIGGRYVDMQ